MMCRNRVVCIFAAVLIVSASVLMAQAPKTWQANAGAESFDQGVQGNGFFPNEMWINAGDSIQWTFVPKNEIHTVTFLTPNTVRPMSPPPAGPPVGTPGVGLPSACVSTQTYTGANCVSSYPTAASTPGGNTFTVTFPNAGNFKLVCLVHTNMNGAVHVLPKGSALPYSQNFYSEQGADQAFSLTGTPWQSQAPQDGNSNGSPNGNSNSNTVFAGTGHIVGTGGGTQYRAVVRFVNQTITIHKGESVTWTNIDPTEPHTVTFGTEPAMFTPTNTANLDNTPAPGITLLGTVTSTSEFLSSGFLQTQAPDRTVPAAGDVQLPLGITRITITFPNTGTFQYRCALHDVDGMVGTVIVVP